MRESHQSRESVAHDCWRTNRFGHDLRNPRRPITSHVSVRDGKRKRSTWACAQDSFPPRSDPFLPASKVPAVVQPGGLSPLPQDLNTIAVSSTADSKTRSGNAQTGCFFSRPSRPTYATVNSSVSAVSKRAFEFLRVYATFHQEGGTFRPAAQEFRELRASRARCSSEADKGSVTVLPSEPF